MRLFGRPSLPAPRLTGAVAFLSHLPNVMVEARAAEFFAGLGGFAFALALDDTFRALGRPGQFYTADWGNSAVYVADGFTLDHTGFSSLQAQEPITRDNLLRLALGPVYARKETLDRDTRWAARMIANAQARADAPEPIPAEPVARLAA